MSALNPDPKEPTMKIFGRVIALKYLSLICLVVQNSSMALTMRYSRTYEGPLYLSSTAVVLSELLKMLTSFFLLLAEDQFRFDKLRARIKHEILDIPLDMLKLSIPAILYTIQNNLQYVAISHLDAATFQVTYQLKIMTTALFSVFLLGKSLNSTKWISLAVLTIGVALVQIPPDSLSLSSLSSSSSSSGNEIPTSSPSSSPSGPQGAMIGLIAVLTACVLSGFAGVYFEKILKGSPVSIWVRNIQLGFYGTLIGLLVCYLQDGPAIAEHGFFYGYNLLTAAVILNQALGGLLVAVVVKYADNILKGYATSISIIISSLVSVVFFGIQLTFLFLMGASMVIWAVYLYS